MTLRTHFITIALTLLISLEAEANVRLPALFSDHMVLQRDVAAPVWGWADAGERVTVSIAGQDKVATSDDTGKWSVKVGPLKVGEPLTLVVKGKNTITIQDVLVGEVWLGSGQSNMQLQMDAVRDADREIAAANDPQLRMITVPRIGTLEPKDDFKAPWQTATPATVRGWSAVAYFYAKNLREKLGVPVGIVLSSYGGTPAEAWTSSEALSQNPAWRSNADKEIAAIRSLPEDVKAFPARMEKWLKENGVEDPGNAGLEKGWATAGFDDSSWKEVEIPASARKTGLKSGGIVWFRRSFVLPEASAAKDFQLVLGGINDAAETVYFNGTELKPMQPSEKFFKVQPRFQVTKSLIKPGQPNTVAVRLHALTPDGTWNHQTKNMGLPVESPGELDNQWKFQVEKEFAPLTPAALAALPKAPQAQMQNTSTTLFNAMINPLIPYAIKGAIWYQGESNVNPPEHAIDYRKLLPAMIADWRSRWSQGDFPFYIVQLANFGAIRPQPGESVWALLRESQSVIARTVPESGLAVIIDIGEVANIHPKNKQDVGYRLSLLALNRTYGQKMEDSGPTYESMKIEGGAIRISFTHVDGGLEARGGPLKTFAIAGADKKFVWADAKIDGETVVVSNPQVTSPTAVRYAWADSAAIFTTKKACPLHPSAQTRLETQELSET